MSDEVLSESSVATRELRSFIASMSPFHTVETVDATHYDITMESVDAFRLAQHWASLNRYVPQIMMPVRVEDDAYCSAYFFAERVFDDGVILSLTLTLKTVSAAA